MILIMTSINSKILHLSKTGVFKMTNCSNDWFPMEKGGKSILTTQLKKGESPDKPMVKGGKSSPYFFQL